MLFFFAKYFDAEDKLSPALTKSLSSSFKKFLLSSEFWISLLMPFITTVISPNISLPSKKSKTSSTLLPICSSNFFVNSRKTCISLSPPQYSFNSSRDLFRRVGDSKKIIGIGSSKKNAQQNAAAKLLKILNI